MATKDGSGSRGSRYQELKLLLSRSEADKVLGTEREFLEQVRQLAGTEAVLSDGDTPEFVLVLSGQLDSIFRGYSLLIRKLWDVCSYVVWPDRKTIRVRLVVPGSQCGSIIGKQGSRVKEIRDSTGANIQVHQESLPDSTERCVVITGSDQACLRSSYHLCLILQSAPLRGEQILYVPKPAESSKWRPVFLCGDRAFVIEGNAAQLASPEVLSKELANLSLKRQPPPQPQNLGGLPTGNCRRGARRHAKLDFFR